MVKKRIGLCLILLILGLCTFYPTFYASGFGDEWEEYRSEHFIIYYHPDISESYIREFARNCEHYYHSLTDRLGFSRFNFWLWENRAKIYIYKEKEGYLRKVSSPQWSGATVHIRKKYINTYYAEEGFFDTILPHELSHIILREFIGLDADVPLWFDEGTACANERGNGFEYLSLARRLVSQGRYMDVAELEMQNKWRVTSPEIFYPTAASLVIYLLDSFGRQHFVQFCREIRDGISFYQAMNKIYGIKDADELNERLLNFLAYRKL